MAMVAPASSSRSRILPFGDTAKRKTPSELRGELLLQDETPNPPVLGSSKRKSSDYIVFRCKNGSAKVPRYIDKRVNELFPVRKNNDRQRLLKLPSEKKIVKDIDSDAGEKHNDDRIFLSVTEISSGGEILSRSSAAPAALVMGKVLREAVPVESSEENWNSGANLRTTDFSVSGKKNPLDLTLKNCMRIVSSSSVNWLHRVINSSILLQDHQAGHLHSWVYPQSPLPVSVISALSLATGEGQSEMKFLSNRHESWKESFRSLYYMFRKKKKCSIFYVCTKQFVVMFIADDSPGRTKRICHSYVSQSTRRLRSMLKEQDICYSMPLCCSKFEEIVATDDESDKLAMSSDVDNTPQSLLMFAGNQSVHGLYDFLLNHRSLSISNLNDDDDDVPILCSPVAFENAALTVPEIRCKEVRRADHMHFLPSKESSKLAGESETSQSSSSLGMFYSIEIKSSASCLPPWAVSSMCDVLRSYGTSEFEVNFRTNTTSIGLNVGLDVISSEAQDHSKHEGAIDDDSGQENDKLFGVPNVTLCPFLSSAAFLKCLKYGKSDSYTALLSHV